MTEDQKLSALLRLKRYEQPPAGYYEKLLQDIHRRQRAELLRKPLWSIGLERIQTFFSAHSMGSLSFAGSMAVVAVAGALGISLIGSSPKTATAPVLAAASTVRTSGAVPRVDAAPARALVLQAPAGGALLALDDAALNDARLVPARISRAESAAAQPRYVIDSRPVSYEAAKVSFSF